MKLSEIQGDEALDVLAEIIDPVTEIASDKEIWDANESGKPKLLIVKLILKNHKKSITTILALLNGKNPEEWKPNLLTLPKMILELMDDEEVINLFTSQGRVMGGTSFGSAMENTEGTEEM